MVSISSIHSLSGSTSSSFIESQVPARVTGGFELRTSYIQCHWSLPISPENIRESLVLFSGDISRDQCHELP